LASPWILRAERGAVALAIALFAVSTLWYSIVQARLPDTFSKDGVGYEEVKETVSGVEQLEDAITRVSVSVGMSRRETFEALDTLSTRLAIIEGEGGP
jgi:hypothetical protein